MKVFHPNIHIVSNYMDFDEDVSLTSFRLGGWRGGNCQHPSPAAAETLNPDLGREGREPLLVSSCPPKTVTSEGLALWCLTAHWGT